ncbi:MAG: hypothetical protein H7240_11290 [Glaciimonas sp.]|nr:hypothetical protein [Glaciimonas sp.]
MLYVGANDGMLHGFDTKTRIEKIAFIPNTVYPHLASLSKADYQHHYFVNRRLVEDDAYIRGKGIGQE